MRANGSIQKDLVPAPSAQLEVAISKARDKGEYFSPSFPDKGRVQFQGRGVLASPRIPKSIFGDCSVEGDLLDERG
jgi:hypothetical protein